MYARRKQGIDEATGIPCQNVPRAVKLSATVRPVAHDFRARGQVGVLQHLRGLWSRRDLRLQEAARAQLPDAFLAGLGVDHRAYA